MKIDKKLAQKLINNAYILKKMRHSMDWTGHLKGARIEYRYNLSRLLK